MNKEKMDVFPVQRRQSKVQLMTQDEFIRRRNLDSFRCQRDRKLAIFSSYFVCPSTTDGQSVMHVIVAPFVLFRCLPGGVTTRELPTHTHTHAARFVIRTLANRFAYRAFNNI